MSCTEMSLCTDQEKKKHPKSENEGKKNAIQKPHKQNPNPNVNTSTASANLTVRRNHLFTTRRRRYRQLPRRNILHRQLAAQDSINNAIILLFRQEISTAYSTQTSGR